ncbi:MAG: hypothetical protein ABWZ99_08045 [Ilumatobacteraceae bacterium]
MKWISFISGLLIGGAIVANLDDRQQAKLRSVARSATSGRTASVAGTVTSGVGDIADAATDRVNGVIDTATTAVHDLIAADEPAPA